LSDLALCLHDVRVSGGAESVRMIEEVVSDFEPPLTVHLIVDTQLVIGTPLCDHLRERVDRGEMEIVFHGVDHTLARKRRGPLALFHKNEAEYLDESAKLKERTETAYRTVSRLLNTTLGICPPCWLSSRGNARFFESLKPEYTEWLLHLRRQGEALFSPVISLGGVGIAELAMLKCLAQTMWAIGILKTDAKVRIAIHTTDMPHGGSMGFLKRMHRSLKKRGFRQVLQKDLWA
jgi:predicted deacetylase